MLKILSVICRKGSVHDYSILVESRLAISPATEKLADRGYQGIAKRYANSLTPIKAYRNKPLTQEAKRFNRRLATQRIAIEHIVRLKINRLVDDSNATEPYQRIENLAWTPTELSEGKRIKIRGFPRDHKVKLFRVMSATGRTDDVVTNDLTQNDTSVAQEVCNWRWKIEQFHREAKQLTGLQRCQCRCALLVWIRLKVVADQTGQTIYQVKHGMLSEFLRLQLKSPADTMTLA